MLNNRLSGLFEQNKKNFSIFITAGFPRLEETVPICEELEKSGVDLIELGIPFSDSIADGATIQKANEKALRNGASLAWTLETLRKIRETVKIPVILMGSLNPVLQFGEEKFCQAAKEAGADGVILPDLPLEFYLQNYRKLFEKYDLSNIFLITQNTPEVRIRLIDATSSSFIYAVSMAGVTGKNLEIDDERREYLKRLKIMNLQSPLMVGFGIKNREHFEEMTNYAAGAIVGSAFLREIETAENVRQATRDFVARFL
ncbi:MAG TPA: tryptophan synthase subunit alpha [Pyrinomonadaceae bacterium]|nr:tryptophan synthase subunit alpha [Pyrinomonadaceae bacterium]